MKFALFPRNRKKDKIKEETLLALDVGTSFVKACVFKIKNKKVHILGYGRVPQQTEAMKGAMIINLKNVIENCDLAMGEAVRNLGDDIPSKVILGIAGELVKGVTIMANYDREEPENKITTKEIGEVVKKVRTKAFANVKVQIAEETGLLAEQVEEISSIVTDTFIDGFRVTNPLEFKGGKVTFRVFSTFAPSVHINSLKTIAQSLGFEILGIFVEPYAITRAFEGASGEDFNAVFVDVGGGTTDIALVQKGGIMGTKMMAFGGKVFTRRLETKYELNYKEAEKLKLEYSEKELSETKSDEIRKIFLEDSRVWANGIEIALEEFEDIEIYPSKFFLCGGGALLSEVKNSLVEYPWLQKLRFEKFPDVEFIHPNDLKSIVDDKKLLKDISDVAPAALAYMALELDN